MLNFFDTIIDYIKIGFNLLLNSVRNIFQLVSLLQNAVLVPATVSPFLPSFLSACVSVIVSVGVLKLVIGRDNS